MTPIPNADLYGSRVESFRYDLLDLRNQKVESFNFTGLVSAFDKARAATPTLTTWALTNALLGHQLASSNTAALGGDLAYQYGKTRAFTNIGLAAAQ